MRCAIGAQFVLAGDGDLATAHIAADDEAAHRQGRHEAEGDAGDAGAGIDCRGLPTGDGQLRDLQRHRAQNEPDEDAEEAFPDVAGQEGDEGEGGEVVDEVGSRAEEPELRQ